jgi:hypothetical protein
MEHVIGVQLSGKEEHIVPYFIHLVGDRFYVVTGVYLIDLSRTTMFVIFLTRD